MTHSAGVHDSSPLRGPGVPFPPPFLYVAGFLIGLAFERWVVRLQLPSPDARPLFVIVGWLAAALGLTFMGWGLLTFFLARTSIIPVRPASRLVVSGPYRFSRNPMYVGLAALHLGLALLLDAAWPILLLPLVLVSVYLLVIRREERYLASAFVDEYRTYCRRVRRWL